MHTYGKDQDGRWNVTFYDRLLESFTVVKTFRHEVQAAAFTNFLNGGTQDITLVAELLEEADKSA